MITHPLLVSPAQGELTLTHQGQPMAALVDGSPDGNAVGSPISAGLVRMRPGHVAVPHEHSDTWVIVLLWSAGALGAITLYGPTLSGRIHQKVGQLVAIPPGVPHVAVNPNPDEDVVAFEFRANPSIYRDNVRLMSLQPFLDTQMPVLFDVPEHTAHR